VTDANGVIVANVFCRDDLHQARWDDYRKHLTEDEARRIANGITRLPEFLMQRAGFYTRGGGDYRWKNSRPYHVALSDDYVRAHWDAINTICEMNSIPFDPTGQRIDRGGTWTVYEFTFQLDAIQFWDRFDGRWLRGVEFVYPDRPKDLPPLKEPPVKRRFR
jgi:hypothetical protein